MTWLDWTTYFVTLPAERAEVNADIPILFAHGQQDPVVPMSWARQSCNYLQQLGYAVGWREYPMAHALCEEEIGDIRDWIVKVLGGDA